MKQVWTTGDVSRMCDVSPRLVAKWFDSGRLKGFKIPGGQDRRVPTADLERFLAENKMGYALAKLRPVVLTVGAGDEARKAVDAAFPPGKGFRVAHAAGAFEAGAAFAGAGPAAVLVDVAIGRLDAGSVAAQARKAAPSVPRVALLGTSFTYDDLPPGCFDIAFTAREYAGPLPDFVRRGAA